MATVPIQRWRSGWRQPKARSAKRRSVLAGVGLAVAAVLLGLAEFGWLTPIGVVPRMGTSSSWVQLGPGLSARLAWWDTGPHLDSSADALVLVVRRGWFSRPMVAGLFDQSHPVELRGEETYDGTRPALRGWRLWLVWSATEGASTAPPRNLAIISGATPTVLGAFDESRSSFVILDGVVMPRHMSLAQQSRCLRDIAYNGGTEYPIEQHRMPSWAAPNGGRVLLHYSTR